MAKADYSGRTEQRKAALRRLADAKCLVNERTMKVRSERMPEALNAHADGLQACIRAFDKVLPVERVLLFGSYARGESTPDSDVDLCVVTNGIETQQSAARTLRRAIGRIRNKPALSLVPISSSRLAEKRRIRDPFFETILREGVCLAEKD